MKRRELGDWQTPPALAETALSRLAREGPAPASIIEPTCGEGAFLLAASRLFPDVPLRGYEVQSRCAEIARARLADKSEIIVADFFDLDWDQILRSLPEPILITGNPPWVTSADLGALSSGNLPAKTNFKNLHGLDARTGKSNFDIAEWMILRLLSALRGRRATLAMLCKTAVARRVIEFAGASIGPGGLWRIDAKAHFGAAVDASWFVCHMGLEPTRGSRWPVFDSPDSANPSSVMHVIGESLVADVDAFRRTEGLAGRCEPEWRSGIKHDCARVMELSGDGSGLRNGFGERVDAEADFVFPLLKSAAVANGGIGDPRFVIVPQRALGEGTDGLRERAPRLWAYLSAHRERLRARRSSIYQGQPDFAVFGVGAYSFAPWKVAVSGLYKRLAFALIPPVDGRPVMLDDTCYFLPFDSEMAARAACEALRSPEAEAFFRARIFWDAKRPITKTVLQMIDLPKLLASAAIGPPRSKESPR